MVTGDLAALAAFIAARLDEDETAAKEAVHRAFREWYLEPWHDGEVLRDDRTRRSDVWATTGYQVTGNGALETVTADHIARHDPARALREVEVKRAHLRAWERIAVNFTTVGETERDFGAREALEDVLTHDAVVWSGHPDYLQEWAP